VVGGQRKTKRRKRLATPGPEMGKENRGAKSRQNDTIKQISRAARRSRNQNKIDSPVKSHFLAGESIPSEARDFKLFAIAQLRARKFGEKRPKRKTVLFTSESKLNEEARKPGSYSLKIFLASWFPGFLIKLLPSWHNSEY
jgi:hypothetical protein